MVWAGSPLRREVRRQPSEGPHRPGFSRPAIQLCSREATAQVLLAHASSRLVAGEDFYGILWFFHGLPMVFLGLSIVF